MAKPSVHRERANFTMLVIGGIEVDFFQVNTKYKASRYQSSLVFCQKSRGAETAKKLIKTTLPEIQGQKTALPRIRSPEIPRIVLCFSASLTVAYYLRLSDPKQ